MDNKKIIKLFVSASAAEFAVQRDELGDYTRSLNDIYRERGIYFKLRLCEDVPNAAAEDRKLENDAIRESQFFYILVGRDVDEYTLEEFDVAQEQFQKTGDTPRVCMYFLRLPEGEKAAKGITDFMKRLDEELGHYYNTFSHIDSVKLNMIIEMTRSELVPDC